MEKCDVLIVGGGPAGLRAAELVSAAGLRTVLAEHKPSVGRKFLVAGRGGLNLTHSEPLANFPARYGDTSGRWASLLADCSPTDLIAWAKGLGIETFTGTSGRIFPKTKQAAPLLRRWIERLREQGVSFRARHRLMGFRPGAEGGTEVEFTTASGQVQIQTKALILALGGGSWPQTGSDGEWVSILTQTKVDVAPLTPANCGYELDWPPEFLAVADGMPIKNIVVRAGEESVAGELLITKYGLEGGALYQIGRALRALASPRLELDLKPSFTFEQMMARVGHVKETLGQPLSEVAMGEALRAWKLGYSARLLVEMRGAAFSRETLARLVKAYPLDLKGPRPLAEAISTAGGVRWSELDDHLMLRCHPGVYCAGEMIDWDAPTGGYLLQGCFSTAQRSARGTVRYLSHSS